MAYDDNNTLDYGGRTIIPIMAYGADDWGSDDESIPNKKLPFTGTNTFFHGFIIGIIIGFSIGFSISKSIK